MELIYREMPDNYTLMDSGDWHLGALNCHKEGIIDLVQKVKRRKNCYISLKGDLIDAITPSDKRYAHLSMDYESQVVTPQEQAEEVVALLRPIADQILAVGIGNHEYKLINTFNSTKYICDHLSVPYGGVTFIHVCLNKSGKVMHKLFGTHGNGSLPKGAKDPIQRKANRRAALKRKLEHLASDCIFMSMGHCHQIVHVWPTLADEIVLAEHGGKLKQQYRTEVAQNTDWIPPEARFYGCSGSYLKLYSPPGKIGYGEMAMYPPAELGCLEVTVKDQNVVGVKKMLAEE